MKKNSILVFYITTLMFRTVGFAAEQSKYQPNHASVREAIAKGEAREAQAALEAQARDAEEKKLWGIAVWAYGYASFAAGSGGHLQTAISNAMKALEMADKTTNPEFKAG